MGKGIDSRRTEGTARASHVNRGSVALVLLVTLVAAMSASVFVARSLVVNRPSGLTIRNFRGQEIPVVGGVVVIAAVLAAELVLVAMRLLGSGIAVSALVPP